MATIVQRLTRKSTTTNNKKLNTDENTNNKLGLKKTIVSQRTQVITTRQPLLEIDANSQSTSNILKGKKNSTKKPALTKSIKQRSNSNLAARIISGKNSTSILGNQLPPAASDTTVPLLNSKFEGQQKSSAFASRPNISYLSENFTRLHALVSQNSFPSMPIPTIHEPAPINTAKSPPPPIPSSLDTTIEKECDANGKEIEDEITREDLKMSEIRDIDADSRDNPTMATEYVNDIYDYLKKTEPYFQVPHDFLSNQDEITPNMRTEIIDWMSEVHLKFRLLSESFFLAINVMDRYLAARKVSCSKFQLLGATAMIIASKHEEIYFPEISDFVYISDNAFVKRDVIDLEHEVLVALKWKITSPTSLIFLRRYSVASGSETKGHTLAKFVIELSLTDYEITRKYLPSKTAAGAVYLSRRMLHKFPYWDPTLIHYTGFKESEVLETAREMNEALHRELRRPQKDLKAMTLKYQAPRFCSVAKIPLVQF